jgi:hypothetical protein
MKSLASFFLNISLRSTRSQAFLTTNPIAYSPITNDPITNDPITNDQ